MSRLRFGFCLLCLLALIALTASRLLAETYQYDAASRLIVVSYDNGLFLRYDYDANGNIVKISSGEQLIFATGFE